MHRLATTFVLGYHGCDRSVGEQLLKGTLTFSESDNSYDWLGPGMYFWEANPSRAIQFAQEKLKRRDRVKSPFVIGAVIDLGLCLDLTTRDSVEELRFARESLERTLQQSGAESPVNGPETWRHNLDCAVIRRLHQIIKEDGLPPIDTVRGVFQEGDPIYPGSAFFERTHVQIAVRNRKCIKGIFRVQEPVKSIA